MPKKRTIASGASFVTTNEKGERVVLTGGQEIELDDDVAAMHADKLEPLPPKADDGTAGPADSA